MLRRAVLRFAKDRKANVAIIFALMLVPIIFLLGMALDYTLALRQREQLNAAADAAAIAAVRPAMLTQTDSSVVQATAILPGTLEYEVVLWLERDAAPRLELSSTGRTRLGKDSWLGGQRREARIAVHVPQAA